MKINFQRLSFLTLSIFMLGFFALPQFSHAQYNASDLLGQLDDNDQPIYTKNGANNGPSNRGFSQPIGIAIDTVNHRLFVGENANKRVLVFNLDNSNNLIDHLPDNVIGQSSFYANISAVTQGGLTSVGGLAYDSTNNRLFVTDPTSHRVLVFDVSTITNGMDASYVLGQANFTSNSSATTQAGMNTPVRATYDSGNNRLFVSEQTNHRVLVFDVSTVTNGMNAEYVLGQPDFTTGTTGTTQSKMNLPGSPVLDAGTQRLFVPEFSNNRVTVWDVDPGTIASGSNAINVLGQALFTTATAATTQAGLSGPVDTSFDSATNRLFVSGFNNHRVTVYDVAAITDGENAVNILGQADFTTGTATTTQSATRTPAGQAYDSANNRLYITERDNNRVIIFDVAAITDGENAVDVLGQLDINDQPVYTKSGADDGPNNRGFSTLLRGVTLDSVHHRLFVMDTGNNRILVFNLDNDNNLIDRVADYVLGQPDFVTNTFNTTQNGLGTPQMQAYDSANDRLFVTDVNNNRLLVFDTSIITNGMNAAYVLGQPDFVTNTATTTASGMSAPAGVVYDSDNNRIFVADRVNQRVLVFNVNSITNGMNASYVLGQTDFVTATSGLTQNKLTNPQVGLAYDTENNRLFLTDTGNRRILVFDFASGITDGMNASYVLGQVDFTTSAAATTTQNGISAAPRGIAYDSENKLLFLVDGNNSRILIHNVAPADISNGQNAVTVIGQTNYTTGTAGTTQQTLSTPFGISFDSENNRIYVDDLGNRRVIIFNFVKLSTTNPTSATQDSIYSQSLSITNSQGTVSYAITSGSLPTGLSLNTSTGEISGTPTVAGTYTFTVQATDDNGAIGYFLSQPQEYTLTVEEPRSNSSGSRPRARTTTTASVVTEPSTSPVQVVELTTPSSNTLNLTRTLRIKDIGEDAKELQKYLNTHGYPVAITGPGLPAQAGSLGNETTKFGFLTHAAVIKFQLANGLVGDGIVGPLTRAFLK